MIPFVVTELTDEEIALYHQASKLVGKVEGDSINGELIRCHELARAVASILPGELEIQDGWFDTSEHTWIWTKPFPKKRNALVTIDRKKIPNILDVYVPGSLPQVQLINWNSFGLPWRRVYYANPIPRTDIKYDVVSELITRMTSP